MFHFSKGMGTWGHDISLSLFMHLYYVQGKKTVYPLPIRQFGVFVDTPTDHLHRVVAGAASGGWIVLEDTYLAKRQHCSKTPE